MPTQRSRENRLKNKNGTVHYAEAGRVACGPINTHHAWLTFTVQDVTCKRCIAKFGADEITGQTDPVIVGNEHVARRAAERAARQAAR